MKLALAAVAVLVAFATGYLLGAAGDRAADAPGSTDVASGATIDTPNPRDASARAASGGGSADRGARRPRRRDDDAAASEVSAQTDTPAADTATKPGAVTTSPAAPGQDAPTTKAAHAVAPVASAAPAADAAPASGVVKTAGPHEAIGVVVNAVTGEPVAGARVLLAVIDGPRAGAWFGETTDAKGRFHNVAKSEANDPTSKFELRVSKDGFEPARATPDSVEQRIALRPRNSSALPARVVGICRTSDGKPFAGDVEIDGVDEIESNATQLVRTDAGGAFVLEGVPHGAWRLSWRRGPQVAVTLTEGGEGRVDLVAAPSTDRDRDGPRVTDIDPESVRIADPALAQRFDALRALLMQIRANATLVAAEERQRLELAVHRELQTIANAAGAGTRRDVVLSGLPASSRTWLRLESRPRRFHRVETTDGEARIAGVAPGSYTAVLVEPGRPDRTIRLEVPSGEGPFRAEFR